MQEDMKKIFCGERKGGKRLRLLLERDAPGMLAAEFLGKKPGFPPCKLAGNIV